MPTRSRSTPAPRAREPIAPAPEHYGHREGPDIGAVFSWIMGLGIIGLLLGFGVWGIFVDVDGFGEYLAELAPAVTRLIILAAVVLIFMFAIEKIRNLPRYDDNGAAIEVSKSHNRIGTRAEKAGDNTTAAIKYASRTALFIALTVTLWSAST